MMFIYSFNNCTTYFIVPTQRIEGKWTENGVFLKQSIAELS